MSRGWKITIAVGLGLLLMCILSCGLIVFLLPQIAQRTVTQAQDPTQAKKVASQIADYTLPPGYSEQMAMDFFVEKIVTLAPTNKRGPIIMLLQVPAANANRQQMEQQMNQQFQNQFQTAMGTMVYVGTHDLTIKGDKVALNVTESNTTTFRLRQATGFFSGKGGLAMMMIQGETGTWDWALIENFCASIR